MAFQLATQKELRAGVFLFIGLAVLLWVAAIFMPIDSITETVNGHKKTIYPDDPRFPHLLFEFRLFVGSTGVFFALGAWLMHWLSKRPSGI
jgi:hypothetical protein